MDDRRTAAIIVLSVIITGLVVGFAVYFWQQNRIDDLERQAETQSPTVTRTATPTETTTSTRTQTTTSTVMPVTTTTTVTVTQ